jgi:hypothetical protein
MTASVWVLVMAFAVGLLLAMWMIGVRSDRRDEERRRDVEIELQQWAAGKGWNVGDALPEEVVVDRVHRGERLLLAAHGDHAGQRCAVLVYEAADDTSLLRFVVCVLRLRQPCATLRIRRRYFGSTANPPAPDGTEPLPRFDRRLQVDRTATVAAGHLLTVSVRAALLRLDALVPPNGEFVLIDGRMLRAVVMTWPPRIDLDGLLSAMADVAMALPDEPAAPA